MIRWVCLLALVGCAEDVFNRKSMACSIADTLKYTNADLPLRFVQPEAPEPGEGCFLHAEGLRGGAFDRVDGGEIEAVDVRQITTEGDLPTLDLAFDRDGAIELFFGDIPLQFVSAGRGSMSRVESIVQLRGDRAILKAEDQELVNTDGPVAIESNLATSGTWSITGSNLSGDAKVTLEANGARRFQDDLPGLRVTTGSVVVDCAECTTRIEIQQGELRVARQPAEPWILCVSGEIEYTGPLVGVDLYLSGDARIRRDPFNDIRQEEHSSWPAGGRTFVAACPDS